MTAAGGVSNASRVRLWKWELQRLAHETGLVRIVCVYPLSTSKWNKFEHWFFAFIRQNWRGQPPLSCAVLLYRIAATTTTTGPQVTSDLDTNV